MKKFFSVCGLILLGTIAVHANAATNWVMDARQSTLKFAGTQAGAPFQGSFGKFTADINFDPADLATSRFDVSIDLGSVNTQDNDRDETIKGADFFAVSQWPRAHYVTQKISAKDTKTFVAIGKLTLRNITRDVPITFTFETKGDQAQLKGSAALKRLDFGVGQGEWKDTSSVADAVTVQFSLALKKQ
jgi:polyisoprenoid-binding protein YceI